MKKLFLGYYNKSVILTYIGTISAVIGMALSFSGKIKYALICLIVCGVSDLFDGMIARRCKRTDEEKEFGIQIDSLNDMVSFALFPVIISVSMGFNAWYYIAVYSFYVVASITRLGFFQCFDIDRIRNKVLYRASCYIRFAYCCLYVYYRKDNRYREYTYSDKHFCYGVAFYP
ncbi:MAG: CDP-alcohol phosphatidyltransferase family protein [Oscillospiraceae bacterium]|nr:CDP-alcohol phosphatidyltransferase family protein [Oscillospiraceae bacterium]